MAATTQVLAQFDQRRAALRMSMTSLARRAGISVPTVRRLLAGRESRPRIDIVTALAVALGVEVRLSDSAHVHESVSTEAFREAQARTKAKRMVKLVQGTMALEAEAVGAGTLRQMEQENFHALMAGSARRLWAE